MWVWTGTQIRLGWQLASVEAVVTWMFLLVSRGLFALIYNRLIAPWRPFRFAESTHAVTRVPVASNLAGIAAAAVTFGILLGFDANVWGWTLVIQSRWVLFPAMLLAAALVYGAGSAVLYNVLVQAWRGTLQVVFRRRGADDERLIFVAPRTVFRAVATLTFLWFAVGIAAIWLVGGTLLVVLANRFPAGWFGFDVEVFAASSAALIGYVAALLIGLWYALGARLLMAWRRPRAPWVSGRPMDQVVR